MNWIVTGTACRSSTRSRTAANVLFLNEVRPVRVGQGKRHPHLAIAEWHFRFGLRDIDVATLVNPRVLEKDLPEPQGLLIETSVQGAHSECRVANTCSFPLIPLILKPETDLQS